MKKYDAIIVGAGPAGVFCALEMIKKSKKRNLKVLVLDEGSAIEKEGVKQSLWVNVLGAKCVA